MAITRITKGVIKPNENYDTRNIVSTGIITSVGADINGDLDVDGHTNLDNVSISGVTTFAGSVNNLVLSGVVTTTGLDVNGNADISGNMSVGGVLTYEDVTSIDSIGIITARNDIHVGAGVSAVGVGTFGSLDIGGDIDVDGHTNLDNVNIAGVTTTAGNVDINAQLDVSGQASLSGFTTATSYGLTTRDLYTSGITTVHKAFRVDGKSEGTGLMPFVVRHGGYQGIQTSLFTTTLNNYPELVLENTWGGNWNTTGPWKLKWTSPNEGDAGPAGDGRVLSELMPAIGNAGNLSGFRLRATDGSTGLKNVFLFHPQNSRFYVTNSSGTIESLAINAVGVGITQYIYHANNAPSDINTRFGFAGNGNIRFETDGTQRFRILNDSSTFSNNLVANADLDVDGHTNLDNVNIAGVTTFTGNADFSSRIQITSTSPYIDFIDNNNNPDYRVVADNGAFGIYDIGSNAYRIQVNSDGHIDLKTNVDCEAGLDVTGNITVSGTVDGVDIAALNTSVSSKLSNIVEDTTPQLGGDLDVNGKKIKFPDLTGSVNNILYFGTGDDLLIYHLNDINYIQCENSRTLRIQQWTGSGNETLANFIPNGAVELYHNNAKKIETTNTGVTVTGSLVATSNIEAQGAFKLGNGNYAIFGASNGMFIYHTGTLGFIDNNVGTLKILSDSLKIRNNAEDHDYIVCNNQTSVDLYYDNSKKFETTSTGISVTGGAVLTSTDTGSSAEPEFVLYRNSASPADADYLGQIKFNGKSDTGAQRTYAKITGKILDASNGTEDGIIEFAHIKGGSQNISARFRSDSLQLLNGTALTVAGSTTVTGNIIPSSDSATDIGTNSVRFANAYVDTYYGDGSNLTGISVGGSSGIDFNDNVQVRFGTGNDAQLLHTGGQFRILNDTGDFYIKGAAAGNGDMFIEAKSGTTNARFFANSGATFYFAGNERIRVNNLGIDVGTSHLAIGATVETNGQASFTGIVTASSFKLSDGSNVGGVDSDAQLNTVAGTNAGNSFNGLANNNTLYGYEAGTAITSADGNTAVGYQALKTATTGGYSTAVGRGALEKNNGTDNTAVGFFASNENTSGTNNNSFGQQSGRNTTSGSWNCSFGNLTLNTNQTGNYNTCFGGFALRNSTSDNNTAIGYNAGVNVTSGQSNTCVGSRAGQSIQTTSSNTCIGDRAGFTAQGEQNTYVGKNSGYNGGGSQNVGIGYLALRAHSSGGAGSYNVAIGYESGYTLSGSNNTLVGQQSGYDLTSGSYNTGIGNAVLYELTTGNYNSVLGRFAGRRITTGHNNTCIGDEAGDNITTGSNNLLLGHDATASSVTVSNEVTIGDTNITKFRIPGINVTLKDNGGTPTQGHVLTVDGNGEAGFAAASGTTINSNADNRVITGSGSANTLNAESTLTYDGTTLSNGNGGVNVQSTGGDLINVTSTATNSRATIKFNTNGNDWEIGARGSSADNPNNFYFYSNSTSNYRLLIDSAGQVLPGADDSQNLGSSSMRWKNIYAADMHFSNKGKTNDVDGTWGDWTLQEGEDSVFMINNRTGKKYAITMKEVN